MRRGASDSGVKGGHKVLSIQSEILPGKGLDFCACLRRTLLYLFGLAVFVQTASSTSVETSSVRSCSQPAPSCCRCSSRKLRRQMSLPLPLLPRRGLSWERRRVTSTFEALFLF
jgi:hypothetical protein